MSILKKLGEIMARIKAFLFTGPAKASDPGQQSQVNQLTAPLFQPNAAFYGSTVTVDGLLFAGLFAPDATFYGPTITTGTALVAPLFAPSASFYSATVNQSLVAARYSASDTFYSPIVGTGTFLAAPLFAPTASFYAPSLNLNLTAPLVTASSTFFGLAITPANSLAAGLFAPTATFYSPSIGLRLVAPLLTANTTFRTATISMAQIPGQALSTPVVTLTSSQPPEADITMGSDIYAGYFLRIQRSADGVKNASDGTYANATLNITHQVTPSEVAVSEITQDDLDPDGYFDPAGAWFQQYRWERDDGAISAWSNEISGTSSGSVAAFSKVTGVNKTRYLTMTSNLAGAMNTTVNALRLVRTTIPKTGKGHFEIEIDALSAVATVNGSIGIGITDATSNLDLTTGSPAPGLNAPGLTLYVRRGSTAVLVRRNGGQAAGTALDAVPAVGDVLMCEFDTAASSYTFKYKSASGTKTLATGTLTTQIPAAWHGCAGGFCINDGFTANFGGSTFAVTPTTDYAGW